MVLTEKTNIGKESLCHMIKSAWRNRYCHKSCCSFSLLLELSKGLTASVGTGLLFLLQDCISPIFRAFVYLL